MIKNGLHLVKNGDVIKNNVKLIIKSALCDMKRVDVGDVYYDEFGQITVDIYGGWNGTGNWSVYFQQLNAIVGQMSGAYLMDMLIDATDDIWTASFALSDEYLKTLNVEFDKDVKYYDHTTHIEHDVFGEERHYHFDSDGTKVCKDSNKFTNTKTEIMETLENGVDAFIEHINKNKEEVSKMDQEERFRLIDISQIIH